MTRRLAWRVAAASATVLTISTTLAATTAAQASPTGVWTKLSTGGGISPSNQPRVVRWQGKLIVVWPQATPDFGHTTIHTRTLGANGRLLGPVHDVVSWRSVSADPEVFLLGGVPTVAFGGNQTGDTFDPYDGVMVYAQATDAASWALGAGSLTHSLGAVSDYGFGAVDDGTGQPTVAGAFSSTDHLTGHHGIDATIPATAPDFFTGGTADAQDANVARDLRTSVTYGVWYSASSIGSEQGIRAAEVWPTVGAVLPPAPLSTVDYQGAKQSNHNLQDVGVVGRIGGGVWAVYTSGYPAAHRIVLWHVGTSQKLVLNTSGYTQYPTVAAGPGGRLWVMWIQGSTVYAVRTNPSVTKFGVIRVLDSPHQQGTAPNHTAGDGSLGPLDAVLSVPTPSDNATEIVTTRILEGLHVAVSPARTSYAHGGTVVVTVTDAGVPVAGVAVRIGSVTKHTNARGKASFPVAKHTARGAHVVTASGTGWWPGSTSFTVG